jgi:hypothetical protein
MIQEGTETRNHRQYKKTTNHKGEGIMAGKYDGTGTAIGETALYPRKT